MLFCQTVKREPKKKRRLLSIKETKEIKELFEQIEREEAKYDSVILQISRTNSWLKEFDELIQTSNEISVSIDNLKQKIHLLRTTGKKYGLSLDKEYSMFVSVKIIP